ncbi:MAG TPA: AAA family ATPase [Thermoleophilaceae bacterium]
MPETRDALLLERSRELEALERLLAGAGDGDGRLALIEGQAGIGKSRLLVEARRRAEEAGMRVLTAKGSELEGEFAFGVVRQLFEPALMDAQTRESWLGGAAAAARAIFEAVDESPGDAPRDVSFSALHGLYWLVVNATADRPLLLALDDLHWVDRPSLRFVAYLVRRLEGLPVLVATTLRTTEPGSDPALLAEIANDPATVPVQPGALSPEGVAQLVRERLSEDAHDAFSAACHGTTGGNPLLLRQLLTSLEAEGVAPEARNAAMVRDIGPRAVSRTVLLRLARLPAAATAVARAVAVLGESADVPSVAALAELDERVTADATASLARAEILRPDPPLSFVHPLVRDAIYHDLPPGERELQHASAARMLSGAGAPPEQVASHLLTVPRRGDEWVSSLLVEAGREALRKGAPESAVSYMTRALEEPPPAGQRGALLLELGLAEVSTFGPDAVTHLREAHAELADPVQRAIAAYALARTLLFTGAPAEGAALAERTAAALPDEMLQLKQGLESLIYYGTVFGGAEQAGLERFERYRVSDPDGGPGTKMLQAVAAYDWAVTGGGADECSELALESLAGGVLVREDNGLSNIPPIATLALADRDEALEHLDEAGADAHRRGALFAVLGAHCWRAFALRRRGELLDAEAEAQAGYDDMVLWGQNTGTVMAYTATVWCEIRVERGELAAAEEVLALAGEELAPDAHSTLLYHAAHAELMLARGRPEEALAAAEAGAAAADRVVNPAWIPWRSQKARALDRLGRTDEALAVAAEELPLARAWGAPGTVAQTLRAIGTIEREAGVERLREAVATVAGSPARLEHAKCLAALGGALRRARQPTEAREPLREALELAFVCGAAGLADEVRTELNAAGVRPRTEALSGPAALTAKERKVAALAAEGQTNRDIAQTLYVTPKTVEVHLTNAYRKLGIRSRRELSQALAA